MRPRSDVPWQPVVQGALRSSVQASRSRSLLLGHMRPVVLPRRNLPDGGLLALGATRTFATGCRGFALLVRALLLVSAMALPRALAAQPPVGSPPPASASPAAERQPEEYSSPYEAFDAGAYVQALDGFVDRQTERPEDPELNLNVGAAHYKLNDFASADAQFYQAAATGDDELRAQALYNLGNSAYRQGKLGEAIDFYMASLEANSDDLDAKFNLEFTREELKKQQQQQNQDQDGQDREQENRDGAEQDQQQSEDPDRGEQSDGQQQDRDAQDQSEGEGRQDGEGAGDSDRDGLDDDLERNAENPTDPRNPDSDADGLPDGQEDRNRNGRVDPGETDPNRRDSDGDGIPDAADTPPEGDRPDPGDQGGPAQPPQGMTPEEAERLLQALEEGRLDPERRGRRGRSNRQAKDW